MPEIPRYRRPRSAFLRENAEGELTDPVPRAGTVTLRPIEWEPYDCLSHLDAFVESTGSLLTIIGAIRNRAQRLFDTERTGAFVGVPYAARPHMGSESIAALAKAVQDAVKPADLAVVVLDKRRFARAPAKDRESTAVALLHWLDEICPEFIFYYGQAKDMPARESD